MFSALSKTETIILATINLSSANAFNLDLVKILLFGKEISTNQLNRKADHISTKYGSDMKEEILEERKLSFINPVPNDKF